VAAALSYVSRGVELVRSHWRLYTSMTLLYAMPALVAGWLVAVHDEAWLDDFLALAQRSLAAALQKVSRSVAAKRRP
jgi:hypothetical protein